MNENPDEIHKYIPKYCKQCGEEFNDDSIIKLHERKQEIVIPPITPKYIEHRSFRCTCSKCGTQTTSDLPSHLKDIMNIPISEGTIYNIIESMSRKAMPVYEIIKEKVAASKVVGGDETSMIIINT